MIDPTRIATVGHAMGRPTEERWASAEFRRAAATITDAEIAYFPRHIIPGVRFWRGVAQRPEHALQPPHHLIMVHAHAEED